jgi:DinB superfamily
MKKSISTDLTPENITLVMQMLGGASDRLDRYAKSHSAKQLTTPLGKGERRPTEVLAHILHCEARSSEAILLALTSDEPELTRVHPERDFGKLVRYDLQPFAELVEYFRFRRAVLMRVLEGLTPAKWVRVVREPGKARKESVYLLARGQATHEEVHLAELGA